MNILNAGGKARKNIQVKLVTFGIPSADMFIITDWSTVLDLLLVSTFDLRPEEWLMKGPDIPSNLEGGFSGIDSPLEARLLCDERESKHAGMIREQDCVHS